MSLILSLEIKDLLEWLKALAKDICFVDIPTSLLSDAVDESLDFVQKCFSSVNDITFSDSNNTFLNHLHSDQQAYLFYRISRYLFLLGNEYHIYANAYIINKAITGLDCYPSVSLLFVYVFLIPQGLFLQSFLRELFVGSSVLVGDNFDGFYPEIAQVFACSFSHNRQLCFGRFFHCWCHNLHHGLQTPKTR